jgi:hypothetical protein
MGSSAPDALFFVTTEFFIVTDTWYPTVEAGKRMTTVTAAVCG